MRLVALVQQGSGAANAMFVLLPYSRCKVTYDVRCLVISMFQVYQKVALALLQPGAAQLGRNCCSRSLRGLRVTICPSRAVTIGSWLVDIISTALLI
jgi:hypothetical protein